MQIYLVEVLAESVFIKYSARVIKVGVRVRAKEEEGRKSFSVDEIIVLRAEGFYGTKTIVNSFYGDVPGTFYKILVFSFIYMYFLYKPIVTCRNRHGAINQNLIVVLQHRRLKQNL